MIGDRTLSRDDFPFPLNRPVTGQDLLQLLPRLLQPLWSQAANAVRGTTGTVTAVAAHQLTLTVAGQSVTARYVSDYTPVVGDTVIVLYNASTAVVLGKPA